MTSPPPPASEPAPGLPVLLAGLRRRLRRERRRPETGDRNGARAGARPEDPLVAIGQQLQQARQSRGLGLRQLADETRISTAVLEALERGWRDRLPEAAYLRTMLPLLEDHLGLAAGSLRPALPAEAPANRRGGRAGGGLGRFTPGSIDVFTSWEGTLIYALLTLALVLGLNRQQLQLAQRGLLSVEPLPVTPSGVSTEVKPAVPAASSGPAAAATPDGSPAPGGSVRSRDGASRSAATSSAAASSAISEGAVDDLLTAFPELRPLQRAAVGQALPKLRQEQRHPDAGLGQLQLQLSAPSRLSLSSRTGSTELRNLQGELALPVLPPFQLRLSPSPQPAAVRWNGKPLQSSGEGRFRYPPAARP